MNWSKIAKQNGIAYSSFRSRIRRGWSLERAATEQPRSLKKRADLEWIEIAERNGIGYYAYINRVDRLHWTPEDAATTPLMRQRTDKEWIEKAIKNNIPSSVYRARVDELGWTPEEAAITPKEQRNARSDRNWIEKAKENGISYFTYIDRVDKYYWDPEEAATTPAMSSEESIKVAQEIHIESTKYRHKRINKDKNNLFKITPQHIEKAKKNGISKATVHSRIYRLGWTVQEAITVPVQKGFDKTDEYYAYLETAKKNNISVANFNDRLRRGWTLKDAATKALILIKQRTRADKDWIEKAIQNGIRSDTYRARIKAGWTTEEASTIQPLARGQFLNDEKRENVIQGFKKFRGLK
ncbi:hypothetical protein GN156_04060 [bacterium LRH843]|nr:hypothetical protein [bacterium LRH843]